MKNSLERLSRSELAEERLANSKQINRNDAIQKPERKRMKKNGKNLREMVNTIKLTNIHIIEN